MGFTLTSNFFFSILIAALGFLHFSALVHLSRVQLRSVTLTQELALLQEKVDRALRAVEKYERRRTVTMHLPSLSIITPSYKHAEFIERTIRSVVEQRIRASSIW